MSSNGLVANAIGAAQEARIKTEQVNRLTAQLADAEQNVKDLQEMLRLNATMLAQQTDAARRAESEAAEWKEALNKEKEVSEARRKIAENLTERCVEILTAYFAARDSRKRLVRLLCATKPLELKREYAGEIRRLRPIADAAKIVVAKYTPLIEWLDRRLAHGDTIAASGPLETYIAERVLRDALAALDARKQT